MSGGRLDYFYSALAEHVGDFNDRELDDLVKDLSDLFYEREWFLSGDTCEGKWVEARAAFKHKWFSEGVRKDRIETYLDDVREELLCMLGLSERYCKNCKHWTQDTRDNYEKYGNCALNKDCLWHRMEHCEKFEKRGG